MGTISRVTTWSTGDTLTASDLNGEFDNILSTANGSINADNLGVTAGIASALKAVVLDSNKDFADGTGSNQIRNLTISGSLKIGTTFLPDASGGADLGSATLEWGDLYIADDKYIKLGSDQNINIGYDETTTDSLKIAATEGAALAITLMADEGDDAGDEWKLNVADGGTITLGNDIASAGTFVTHLTLTPHATVASSTLALAGGLTVAGTAGITGVATVGGLTIGSAVINEAELETIDGVTAGTVAASKAVVVDSNKDIGTFRNITLNGTLSDGNYTFDTSGNVTGLGTVGSGAITSTGVVTGTGFTIGSAAINEAELETIDGVTAGTVAASKAVVVDSNKDISSFRNVTLTGELDAATGDFSGDVDVDGTLEADAITLNGTALGSLYSPIAGSSSIVTVGTIGTGTWQGTAVASAYLDADTAHLSTIQTFSGAKTFSAAAQFSSTVTVGVNDTGYDVKFFGATAGSSLLWDESADDLILTNAGIAVGSDATGDLYYRNASGFLARLGVGDDGQVLTSTGTLPNWEAASGGGGHTIQEEGSGLTQRANLNFVGAGVTATDDSGNDATKITVSATGASMPFIKSDGTTSDPITLTSAAVGNSLVSDTSPQLGGNLDVLARSITTTTTNGDIAITPHGTGKVILDTNLTFDGTILAAANGSQVLVGATAGVTVNGGSGALQVLGTTPYDASITLGRWSANNQPAKLRFVKSRNATIGSSTIVADGDIVGGLEFYADDGGDFENGIAHIHALIDGTPGANDTPGALQFSTTADGSGSPTERMRISANGSVKVNTSLASGHTFNVHNANATNPSGMQIYFAGTTSGDTSDYFYIAGDAGATRAINFSNGDWDNTNNSYSGFSDIKLKQDVTDARNYWDDFKALRYRKYRLKSEVARDENAGTQIGLVAQEMEAAFPNLVNKVPDRVMQELPVLDEDGNATYKRDDNNELELDGDGNRIPATEEKLVNLSTTTKSIKYSILHGPVMATVVQELQTRLEAAEAKITALESA